MRPAAAHLLRPVPPWRESRTWCGLPPAGLVITTREAFTAMRREDDTRSFSAPKAACPRCRSADGWQRTNLDWDTDPVEIIGLDCAPPRWAPWRAMLRPELRALAALAARHQKEFRTLLERETAAEAQADEPG